MVVEYADKYGVNIPLSQHDDRAVGMHSGVQEQQHADLAALLQSVTSNILQSSDLKDAETEVFMAEISGHQEDGLDLSKLIEQTLSTHKPELKAEAPDEPTASGQAESIATKDLASLISERLNVDMTPPTGGLPSLPMPSCQNGAHSPSDGKNCTPDGCRDCGFLLTMPSSVQWSLPRKWESAILIHSVSPISRTIQPTTSFAGDRRTAAA